MKADHQSHSEKALGAVRDAIRADVEQHDLDSLVAERVKYFSNLFKKALNDAFDDSRALDERDPNLARRERARRRKLITEFEASDRIAKRAPQPSFENVAGSPDELIIQLSPPEGSEQVLYALVDVSQIDNATARKWIRYLEPLKITTPGKYVVLSKTVVYEPYCCESRVATAVYELGPSPPLMQYEGCPRELAYVADNANKNLVCVKCGRSDRKLYARGDYCICRDCALKGAGVMIDPGARRMWFSQMISFVGGKAIPLPRSQPLLAQILRVMQLHPGMTVRFEGHVSQPTFTFLQQLQKCP